MTLLDRTVRILLFVAMCSVYGITFCSVANTQNAQRNTSNKNTAPTVMQQMVGTWNVQQRMWPGFGAEAINLPPAIAHRRLVNDIFLEEVMELAQKSGQASFTRTAYFNYNTVNQQYEYFSLDSRAPQMMNEKSRKVKGQNRSGTSEIKLYGGNFVAPRWGKATNVAFKYQLTVGKVEKDRQVVQLYLTPQSGQSAREFLAFEYVYTLQH